MTAPHTTDELIQKMFVAGLSLKNQVETSPGLASTLMGRLPPNFLFTPREDRAEGRGGKHFTLGGFELGEDQALIVERLPLYLGSNAVFSRIDLGNFWWQSLDYTNRQAR